MCVPGNLRRQYNLGVEKLDTRDRQLPLINWSEPRHCNMQEGSAIRPWAGPSTPSCSDEPYPRLAPQARSAMQVVTSHKPLLALFKESFLARSSTPRKSVSRETCLKDNAACAQNAILAVVQMLTKQTNTSSRSSASCSLAAASSSKEGQRPRVRDPWCPQS